MPTILREDGCRFFFYSDEGNPREPPHVHVTSGEKVAKFWLDPVDLATSKRLSAAEIVILHKTVVKHQGSFLEAWHAYFESGI